MTRISSFPQGRLRASRPCMRATRPITRSALPTAHADKGITSTDRYGATGMASVGTFNWGGAYGSAYYVDPAEHLVIVFMINQLPNRTDIAGTFPTLVYQALVASRR